MGIEVGENATDNKGTYYAFCLEGGLLGLFCSQSS